MCTVWALQLGTLYCPQSNHPQKAQPAFPTTSGPVNITSAHTPRFAQRQTQPTELRPPSRKYTLQNTCCCLAISTPGSIQTAPPGPRCIGHFGVRKLNENGQRLFKLCSFHDLCITNTFFTKNPPTGCPVRTPNHVTSTSWISLSPADSC